MSQKRLLYQYVIGLPQKVLYSISLLSLLLILQQQSSVQPYLLKHLDLVLLSGLLTNGAL